jgi:hypothetical protein
VITQTSSTHSAELTTSWLQSIDGWKAWLMAAIMLRK